MGHNVPTGINPPVAQALAAAMKGKERINFTPPGQKTAQGDLRSIPAVACQSIDSARSKIQGAGFQVAVSNARVTSTCPPGTAAGTSPTGRTTKGGVVTIEVSGGGGGPDGGQSPGQGRPGG
jgi:hypothetical protein